MADRIDVNRTCQPGDTFRSNSDEYRFCFQQDGNIVLYKRNNEGGQDAIWTSGTDKGDNGGEGRSFVVQGDGNIVLYESDGTAIWASGSNYDAKTPYLSVQDDGNVVLYDEGVEGAHWQTGTSQ